MVGLNVDFGICLPQVQKHVGVLSEVSPYPSLSQPPSTWLQCRPIVWMILNLGVMCKQTILQRRFSYDMPSLNRWQTARTNAGLLMSKSIILKEQVSAKIKRTGKVSRGLVRKVGFDVR